LHKANGQSGRVKALSIFQKVAGSNKLVALAISCLSLVSMSPAQGQPLLAKHKPETLLALGVVPMVRGGSPVVHGRSVNYSRLGGRARRITRGAFTPLKKLPKQTVVVPVKSAPAPAKPHVAAAKPAVSHSALKTLSSRVLYDGVNYKVLSGSLPSGGRVRINLVDIDMSKSQAVIRPVSGSSSFARLKDVREHSRDSGAIAAINANYFKTNGVPLGTLIEDGDWKAGPLYDRVTLGFTDDGYARIDRVSLHGKLYTDAPDHPVLWINNVNQPRRTGSRCILYTKQWGSQVTLPYEGVLVAVDASGQVMSSDTLKITIPYGGFVLADSKGSPISHLKEGEHVNIKWQIAPHDWSNVTEAVSGGPLLLKDGKPIFDLKAEKFPLAFAGNHVHARTACGITNDDHLIMATFEGPHTLYDVGKFLASQGCIDAMNLDGGGSTTMVVGGKTVTANANHAQRRVAVALGVFAPAQAQNLARVSGTNFRPAGDISSFIGSTTLPFAAAYNEAVSEPLSDPLMTSLMQHDLHLSNKVTAAAATITIDEIAEQETSPPAEDAINITIKP
jgi:hypothetical protein